MTLPGSGAGMLAVNDAIDALRSQWRRIALATFIGAVVGVIAALALPSYYRSEASFQPESPTPSILGGGLAGLASQLGGGALGGGANPQFYADLLHSRVIMRRLAASSFPTSSGPRPLAELYGYGKLTGEKRLQRTAAKLSNTMNVDLNFRTGVVAFSVEARQPETAKAIADSVLAGLNDFNIRIRQSRARAEREFAVARSREAQRDLARAEENLAGFHLRNRQTASPLLQVQADRLRRQVDVASQLALQLQVQAEQAAAGEVRATPALTIIDPPQIAIKRSWPNRRLTVMAATMAGFLLAVAYVLARRLN